MPNRNAVDYRILLNGVEQATARLLSVERSAGGQGAVSSCTFEVAEMRNFAAGLRQTQLQNLFSNQTCEVVINFPAPGGPAVVHFGRIATANFANDPRTDRITLTSRFDGTLFGSELRAVQIAHHPNSGPNIAPGQWFATFADHDTEFNPIVDARPTPNALQANAGPGAKWSIVNPDALWRPHLDDYMRDQQDVANPPSAPSGFGFWNLVEAVYYLCWITNPDQTYVLNPTRQQLSLVLSSDQRILRSLKVPVGERLPQILDRVLVPFGYQWRVAFTDLGSRRIEVYRRGVGELLDVKLQDFGQELQAGMSNVVGQKVQMDLVRSAVNEVQILGDYPQVEGTFELIPGWLAQYDNPTSTKAFKAGSDEWNADVTIRRAWRDFVLNENGDYIGERPNQNTRFDLSFLFFGGEYFVNSVRKRFFPTITLGANGKPIGDTHGIFVEYWDPSIDLWVPVRGGDDGRGGIDGGKNVQVLTNECGIRFASPETPPEKLIAIGNKYGIGEVKIRVTASVYADERIAGFATNPISLMADRVRKVSNSAQQFRLKSIHTSSVFFQQVFLGELASMQVDGRNGAQMLADELLSRWNKASVSGTIELEGCDWGGIELGNMIVGAGPRNVQFLATPPGQNPAEYPTISSIRYDWEAQRTILQIDTYRRSR